MDADLVYNRCHFWSCQQDTNQEGAAFREKEITFEENRVDSPDPPWLLTRDLGAIVPHCGD